MLNPFEEPRFVVEPHTDHAVYKFRVRDNETEDTQGSGMMAADADQLARDLNEFYAKL